MAGPGVPIRDVDGSVGRLSPADAAARIAQGATQLSEDEVDKIKSQKEFGGIGGQAAAFGINAADALTLGFGKGAAVAATRAVDADAGAKLARAIQGYDAANPLSATAGTVTGALAPLLFTGGGSAAVEGGAEGASLLGRGASVLGAPTRALSALGTGATEGAAALLGTEGKTLLGRVMQKGLSGAVGGAVEGGIYGAGGAYSEDMLQDKELTAESLLAGASKGAMFGAALGGGMAAGGEVLSTIGRKAVDAARGMGYGEKSLQQYADELRFSSTGARTPEIRKLEGHGLERGDVGHWMEENLPTYNDGKAPLAKESILKSSQAAVDDFGGQIGKSIDALDATAQKAGVAPDAEKFFTRMKTEVLDKFEGTIGQAGAESRLANVMNDVQKRMGYEMNDVGQMVKVRDIGFKDINVIRREVDDLAYKESKILSPDAMTDQLRSLRGVIEDEVRQQGAKVAGPEWLQRYESANKNFRMATSVRDTTDKALDRINGNNGFSLTDKMAAASGMSGGLASGHPLAMLTGLPLAAANKLMRTYGDAVGANILSRVAKMNAIKGITAESGATLAGKVSSALAGGTRHTAELLYTKGGDSGFDRNAKEIRTLAANPLMVAPMPHSDVAPQTASIYAAKQSQAIQYLNGQLPKGYVVKSDLTPTLKNPPSPTEQKAFMRKLAVYKDPGVVLDEMKRGTLTYEHVDALKAMYPAIYGQIQGQVTSQLAEMAAKGKSPPYAARIQLGMLLQVPADPALDPAFISSQQSAYAAVEKPPERSTMPVGKPPPSLMTASDRLESTA